MPISLNEIKQVKSLQNKKFRDELNLFTVEGDKLVEEALGSGLEVVRVYRREEVGADAMARMSGLATPPPSLAVIRKPSYSVPGIERAKLYLALDSVRDPGNLGTIIRIADWFGIECIFATPDTVDVFNPKVVQSTMGAIFRKKVIYTDLISLSKEFLKVEMSVYGTFLGGSSIYDESLVSEGLLVMGNESNGISAALGELVSHRLTIPSFATGKHAESLNVAVATAVAVSELKRHSL